MRTNENALIDELVLAGSYVNFDGFEYRAQREVGGTYRIIDEHGETIARGILLLSDSPYSDLCAAVVNSTEGGAL